MRHSFVLLAVLLLGTPALAQDAFKVVVHPNNPTKALSKDKVSALFLKKKPQWDDGKTVTPVDLPESSGARVSFSSAVLGKSVTAVKAYWQQRLFAGRDVPPSEKKTDDDVLKHVKADEGAIGYVSPGADVSGVRVISITD